MIKRIYLVILVLLFATPGIFAQQTVTVGDVIVGPGTIEVPVSMTGFTNVNGFQLAFNVDPNILSPVQPDDESYFVSGNGRVWLYNVITDEEFVVQFLDMGYSTVGGVPVFNTHTLNGEVFRLKFTYSGGFPADIDFNVGNSQIMVNGGALNLNNVNFVSGTVAPDPDVVLGTLKLDGEAEAIIGTEYVVPFSMQGDGFDAIRGIQVELSFDPNKLVFNGLDNVPGSGIAFEAIQNGNLISFVWIGNEIDFTTEKTIANLRFTYNSNEEAVVDFTANTRVSTALGEIPYAHEAATFIPKDLDLQLTIEDVYQYSGANVDIPIVLSGVEDDITAGSITIRLGFDASLMSYASMQSDIGFNPPTLTDGVVVLNFVAAPGEDGYTLANGTIATLRFNFLQTGMTDINYLFGPSGTAFTTFEGGTIPISYVNGSAEVSVPGIVYDGLLDARDNTTLELTNPDYNDIVETTTYPASFITTSGQPFFFDVLTDVWMLDGFLEFSEDLPAGTILTLGYDGESFDVILEDGLEANMLLSYKDMVLSAFPDEDVEWPLLDQAGNIEVWTIDIRSPLTFDVTMTSVLSTSHDGFDASEDGEYPGFVLAMDAIDFTIHGDPVLLFAFNGELASTGSEFVYCYDVPVTVGIAEKLEGGTSFDITYTVNGDEFLAENVLVGNVFWGPEVLEAGTYEVVVTNIVDNFGRDAVDPQNIYYATVVINPEPFVYFEFNGVTAAPESEFVYCYDEEITVTLSEIGSGVAPFTVTYTVNGEEETVGGLGAGDELFSALMDAGTYEIVVTSIIDGNGCAVSEDVIEAVYFATVVVNPEPAVLFAFNDVIAVTDSEFAYCSYEEVTITLSEILSGQGPVAITYVLNDDDAVTVADLSAGDVLFGPDVLPVGLHTLVLTSVVDANGCAVANPEDIYKLTILIHALPEAEITADGVLEFCDGGSVILTASEAAEYLWSNGETTQSITVIESGVFSVVVTDVNGCVNTSEEVEVVVNPLPVAEITPDGDLEFCDGGAVVLTASEGTSYLWSNDSTTQSITVDASGSFSVTVTNEFGCESTSDVVTVVVNPLPVANILSSGDLEFCDGGSVGLTASESVSYLWSNDATTRSITVTEGGLYTVTVTDANGCSNTSEAVEVVVLPLTAVTCPNDTTVMLTHPAFALTGATPAGGVYSGAGVTDGMFNASVATVGDHEITYTYTAANGCVSECTFTITVKLDTSVPADADMTSVKVYPNPARTFVTIESNDMIQEIRMVDMLGQVVYSDVAQYTKYELNVSGFKNGIYFVQVLTENGFTTHRVQVTR